MTEPLDGVADPVVEAALQLLPIPDHGDDFWADLAARLDAEDGARPLVATRTAAPTATVFALPEREPAPVADPTPVPGPRPELAPEPVLATIPPAMRRRSNAVLAAVAVAALVVVGLAGAALVKDQSGDGGTELADGEKGDATKQLDKLAATSTIPVGTPDGLSKKQTKAAQTAATTYATDHAAAGASGAWSAIVVTPVSTSDDADVAVVTLIGASGAQAYAVRLTDDGAEVVPTDRAGTIEHVSPEPVDDDGTPATVSTSDDVVVVLPAGAAAPVLRIDDGTPVICGEAAGTHFAAMDGMDRQRCAWTPEALSPGAHTLTVAFLDADGSSISADSVAFQAA